MYKIGRKFVEILLARFQYTVAVGSLLATQKLA